MRIARSDKHPGFTRDGQAPRKKGPSPAAMRAEARRRRHGRVVHGSPVKIKEAKDAETRLALYGCVTIWSDASWCERHGGAYAIVRAHDGEVLVSRKTKAQSAGAAEKQALAHAIRLAGDLLAMPHIKSVLVRFDPIGLENGVTVPEDKNITLHRMPRNFNLAHAAASEARRARD